MLACEELRVQNDPYFDNYYFLSVEKIRVFYHRLKGFSNLSQTKVYKLYTNEHLREVQHKKVPEQEFIDLYISDVYENYYKVSCIFSYDDTERQMKILTKVNENFYSKTKILRIEGFQLPKLFKKDM